MAGIHVAPEAAPVAVAEAKAFLRIAHGDEDALLAGLVRTATEQCEAFTGLALLLRDLDEDVAASAGWTRLQAGPVRSITQVSALQDGAAVPIAAERYAVDVDAAGDGWVRVSSPVHGQRVRVAYTAGLSADWNRVPEPLRQGIVRLAAELYARRDEPGTGPSAAVTSLWRPWRRMRL